jgi:hypothetical protein
MHIERTMKVPKPLPLEKDFPFCFPDPFELGWEDAEQFL